MAALLPANPGEALWIGAAGGKNHYDVGIGQGTTGGNNHEDYAQDLIEEGFTQTDRFYLNSDGNTIFKINAGAGRTSNNTAHPRSELREYLQDGTTKAAWDGRTGIHRMKARSRIIDVTSHRPWVCFAQIHGSPNSPETSDLVRVQVEGDDGTSTNLSIICRRSPPSGGNEIRTVLATGYDLNDWIDWELGMYDGRLKIFLSGIAVLDVTGMGQIGNYFKMGCYLQDNVEKGATATDTAAVEVERGSFVTWHTGYPQPTTPVFTGAADPGGGPGGGDGTPDTQAPTVPQDLVSLQGDEQITLLWTPSTDNVAVSHYNVYRFSDDGSGGGSGTTATVGKTESGTSTTSSSTDKMVTSRHTADADGTLTEGHFRARLSTAGSTTSKMFVYADSSGDPGALLATSDQITITNTAEQVLDYTFSGAAQISIVDGTAYWIAVAWDDPGSPSITYSRDATADGRLEQTLTYPTAPDPFGTPTGTFTGPIDAWLDTVSSGAGGGATFTMGKTSDGASNSASSTDKAAVSSFTASSTGTLTSGHSRVWLSATGTTGTRMVVYSDTAGAPGTCLAVSDEVTVTNTSEADKAYTFSGANQITITSGTTYWVGVAWDDPGTPSLTFSRDSTASQRQETTTFTYPPTVSSSFGTPAAQTGPIDCYVNVVEPSAGYVLLATTTFATYVDTGLTNGTEYTYVVSAEDAAGNESGQSEAVADTPGAPDTTAPSVPANLATVAGDRKVSLTWDASTDDDSGVDYYVVYRGGTQIDTTPSTSFVDVGLSNGSSYSYTVSAVDVAGNASAQSSAAVGSPNGAAITGVPFLTKELGRHASLAVEIAWGADLTDDPDDWEWSDETDNVRGDPGISTSLGRNDESSTSNPAQLTVVLNNDDGDYSLGGRSTHWPYVRRNTPVRVRIDPDDGGGGRIVFAGGAVGFTPGWDSKTGRIPIVTLEAAGSLRRLAQGDAPIQSAYRRYTASLDSVVGYWPMEEGSNATYAPALRGGTDMTFVGRPDWLADDTFYSSDKLPKLKDAVFDADVSTYADTGQLQIRFLLLLPENITAVPYGAILLRIHLTGTIGLIDITYSGVGRTTPSIGLHRYLSDGTFHSSNFMAFDVNDVPGRLSLELDQNGSDFAWTVRYTIPIVGGTATSQFGETITGQTFGIVTHVQLNTGRDIGDTVIGHLSIEDEISSTLAVPGRQAMAAFYGDYTSSSAVNPFISRLERLASENGVPLVRYTSSLTPLQDGLRNFDRMGPQLVAPLLTLLREAEAADQGQLWDGRHFGLSYTTRRRREEGNVRLTIDAANGELAEGFEPTDDDQRTRNDVEVKLTFGITAAYKDQTGPMGTDVIGTYDDSATVNLYRDQDAIQHASWRVGLGTVEGYRYPSVTVDLRAAPHLAPDVLDIVPGERLDVTNLDDTLEQFTASSVSLIVEGIEHEITPTTWRVTFKCSPFEPWAVGRVAASSTGDTSDMVMRVDTDGSTLSAAAPKGATSIQVAVNAGNALWTTVADDFPLTLDVGGLPVTVTACSGSSSPQTMTVAALPVARASGVRVQLWQPRRIGMG